MGKTLRLACFAAATILASSTLAGALPARVPAPAAQCGLTGSATPGGLVVVIPPQSSTQSFDPASLSNPYVSGVAVQVNWRDLEPAAGTFDWSNLDALFARAESSGKWVQLLIFPGFFSPAWALSGVKTDRFPIQYGPGQGTIASLPMPWDSVYLERWFAFLKRLNERYGGSPAFRVIAADGPTSVSAEMTLPVKPQEITQLRNDGYTPAKYLQAWHSVFAAYADDFPNQCISLSAPGVPILEIGRNGPAAHAQARQTVVDDASSVVGGRLVLQWSNLHAGPVAVDAPDELGFITGFSGRIITGLQMRTSAEGSSAAMGAAGNPPLALRRSVDEGMAPNAAGRRVNYLEIYERDVLASEMQPVLKYAASLFASR